MNVSTNGATTAPIPNDNSITALLTRLRTSPRVLLLAAGAFAIAVIAVLSLWARTPDYRVLYSNISDQDGGAIVAQLTQMNIPYRFNEGGSALLIPADKVHETRLRLAQAGLPKGGSVGFELLDKEKFGISQFSEQINYQRALEGELARTIETLGPVQSARVHLALPKPSLFVREQKQPSASVTLTLHAGRALDDGQISAIVYMVSGSVTGLPAGNVTVVDQNGRLLTQPDSNGRDLNTSQLKFTSELESRYQRRIETILAPVVGSGNVHAQVTAQVDYASREQTDEEYRPNQEAGKAAIRSQQLSESDQSGGLQSGGVPGALSNQPAPPPTGNIDAPANRNQAQNNGQNNAQGNNANQRTATTGTQSANQRPENSRRDSTTNYEVDRTIRHTRQNSGGIERLSVAVVVNYVTDAEGKQVPLSDAQMEQINKLVREAMGFSTARGDSLNVINAPFTEREESSSELPFWQKAAFFDLLINAGRYLLVLLIAWLLWRKLVRPLWQKQIVLQSTRRQESAPIVAPPPPPRPSNEELANRKKSQLRANAQARTQQVRELAEQDPRVVALVIRRWMSNEQ